MRHIIILLIATVVFAACGEPPPIPPVAPSLPDGAAPARSVVSITVETAPNLTEIAQFSIAGAGPAGALAFTPDGWELRVVHGKRPILRRWKVADGVLVAEHEIGPVGMGAIAFDGAAAFFATSDIGDAIFFSDKYLTGTPPKELFGPTDSLHLINAENGTLQLRLPGPNLLDQTFHGVAFSRNGQVVAGIADGQILVWRVAGAKETPALLFEQDRTEASASFASDLALGPEGRLLAMSGENGQIQLWDIDSRQDWGQLEMEAGEARIYFLRLAVDPARQWLAAFSEQTSSLERTLTLWDLGKRRLRWQASLGTSVEGAYLHALAFDSTGALLATAMSNGVQVWRVDTGQALLTIPGESVYAVAFSADSALLAWGDHGGMVHLGGVPQ